MSCRIKNIDEVKTGVQFLANMMMEAVHFSETVKIFFTKNRVITQNKI
jgi:hypothetical protein